MRRTVDATVYWRHHEPTPDRKSADRRRTLDSRHVEGLPQDPGAFGFALLILGLLAGAVYARLVRGSVWSAVGGSVAVGWVVLALTATTVGAAPFIAWRVVEDIRYTSALDPYIVPRYGVSVYGVHPEIFDNAVLHIPSGDTYYLAASTTIDGTAQRAFDEWALGYLLPRKAVTDPADADWIVTLGIDPRKVGPPIEKTWVLKGSVNGLPPAYLGKVGHS